MITNAKTLLRAKEITEYIDEYLTANITSAIDEKWRVSYHSHYDDVTFSIYEISRSHSENSVILKYKSGKLVASDLAGYKRAQIRPIQNILLKRLHEPCELPLSTDDFTIAVTKEINIIRHSQKNVLESLLRLKLVNKKKELPPKEIINIPDYTGEFYSSLTKNWESDNEIEIFNYLDGMKKAFTVTSAMALADEVEFLIEINTIKHETDLDHIVSDILEEAA